MGQKFSIKYPYTPLLIAIRRISRIQSVTSVNKVCSWKSLVWGFIVVVIGMIFKLTKTPDFKSAYDALPVSIPVAKRRISRQQRVPRSTVTPGATVAKRRISSQQLVPRSTVTPGPTVYMKILLAAVLVLVVVKLIYEVGKPRLVRAAFDALPVSIPDYRITPLTNGIHDRHMKVPLSFIGWRLWTDGEHVFVGARYDDRIVVMDTKGNVFSVVSLSYPSNLSRHIITGFYIGHNQHLIVLFISEGCKRAKRLLYRIVFSPDMQSIVYMNQVMLPEAFIPYRHNLSTAGILAVHPLQTFLYHNRGLYYDTQLQEPCDSFAPSGVYLYDDHFLITDVATGNLAVFRNHGPLVETINTRFDPPRQIEPYLNHPGILFEPMNVLIDTEGRLIVPCSDGAIHMYIRDNKTWSIVVKSGQRAQDILTLNNNLYKIQDDFLYIFDIKT